MEQIALSYTKGITHYPSDMLCTDGELEDCVNLEVRNEELVPMELPKQLAFSLGDGEELILVHNTKAGDKNYVTITDGTIRIFHVEDSSKVYYDFSLTTGEVKSIQYLGNSIVAYTDDSPYYIFYNGEGYVSLGSRLPEVDMAFDLLGDFVVSEEFEFTTPDEDFESDEYQEAVCARLVAETNKFIQEEATSKGRFMYPFFVRYALRLFDGTHTMHSAPILMLPSTNIAPFAASYSDMVEVSGVDFKAQLGAFIAQLEAEVISVTGELSDWKDIVTCVDIYVSRQISTYDQNGQKFGNAAASGSKFIGEYDSVSTVWDGYSQMSKHVTMSQEDSTILSRWYIPSRETDEVYNEISNTSLFYKYTSIDLEDIKTGAVIALDGVLNSIEVETAMVDDYMTHDVFVPESSVIYNGRLNISTITRKLYEGFPVHGMTQMVLEATQDGYDYGLLFGRYEVYTYIKSTDGDIVVKSDRSIYGSLYSSYFFYPDSDAYKMVVQDVSNNRYAEIPLTEHTLLNGAYAFMGFDTVEFFSGTADVSVTDNTELQLNKLCVSNVNNLFHFPLEGMYTVGSDRIIGMAAVTRPISQGQFGEYPLLAFCSDGNYALRVDEQGHYMGISPVQEDVVLGSDKIVSMENSTAVITKKGIMLTSGNDMSEIAPALKGGIFDRTLLPGVAVSDDGLSLLMEHSDDADGFLEYLYGARMIFDYASNRLVIYNEDKYYSYIYSFVNGTVSKMVLPNGEKIATAVIDYPDYIIQDSNGTLYSLYEKDDVNASQQHQYGFAMTRPLKFKAALSMKSIQRLRNLYTKVDGTSYVKYSIYGSNDNVNYTKLSSLRSKAYKMYRLVFYSNLLPKESMSGTALMVQERRSTHKFR